MIAARGIERGRRVISEIEAEGGAATFVQADVSQAAQVKALVEQAIAMYGRLDCAFNNAVAIEEPLVPLAELTEEQFDRAMALNLKSVWLCMKEEIRQMLAQAPAGGAIVNTSSVNGLGAARTAALHRHPTVTERALTGPGISARVAAFSGEPLQRG